MEQPKPAPGPGTSSMLDVLDRAFVGHLERITGTREGINGLSMGLVTVACIVLVAERAGDAGASGEANPMNRAELERELSEMGLDDPKRLETALEDMVRKGYVELDARDRLIPGNPTLSMARLLDHAFPGMPGVNLVAYFVQTLDEVETGRKPPKKAVQQLDQTLRHHAAAPFAKGRKEPGTRPAPPGRRRMQRPTRLRAPALEGISLDSPAPEPPGVQETPAATEPPDKDLPAGVEAPGDEVDEQEDVEALIEETATGDSPVPMEPVPLEPDPAPAPETSEAASTEEPALAARPFERVEEADQDPSEDQGTGPGPEEVVEERISAFEEELAMQCPVCRKASVEVQETAKGRVYYKCSDEECMFISWGRPHHVPCPLCGNPFLVEADSGGDQKPLKCPRATCRYREPSAGEASGHGELESGEGGTPSKSRKPRKRVVRRKVRRRKR